MVTLDNKSPIQKLIAYCAKNPLVTLLAVIGLSFWGYMSMQKAPLDAIPDLSDAQVIVFTEWQGRSPDLVEDQITYPLTTALISAPNVKFVRGQSFLGQSFVYVIFEDNTDIYWARSRVLEYLNSALDKLPPGVRPQLGPDATGVGWVYQYAVVDKTGQHDLADLRSIQDFSIRYWLEAVDGVAEVASIGGYEKEYQVHVDPNRLATQDIPLTKVTEAIRKSNNDVGGRVLEIAGHEHFIRGRGYIKSIQDIENIVLKTTANGTPVLVKDIATVTLGPAMQRGVGELDGEGFAVGGIVVMRYGENALNVIERVKQRLSDAKAGLPAGVDIVTVYDRSDLINRAMDTLSKTLIEEMIVVSLIILLFLLHVRSALVACITLPIAIILSFIPMYQQGLTANIMSLGGIAVAIGTMVDAAIVMIDNVHKRLAQWQQSDRQEPRPSVVINAMQEVGPSIFFSLLIITAGFLPVFALEGTEGRLFQPLAYTKTYSMGFAALLAITLIPALAILLIRGKVFGDKHPLNKILMWAYRPILSFCLRVRWLVVAVSVGVLVISIPIIDKLGNEFMPPLNEGSLLYMPTALPGMSITESGYVLQSMNKQIKKIPEVDHVFGKIGRSTSATDPAPLSMVETVIALKPKSEWRAGLTWDDLVAEMDEQLRYPGMPNIWWMPIQTRTEMLATGIRSALGIKVFGKDLKGIEKTAIEIEEALLTDERTAEHARSVFAERISGGYFIDFDIKRDSIARYGLTIDDVENIITTAIGGAQATETIEGRERYAVTVRYARDYRDDVDALNRVLVPTPISAPIPLSQLADISFERGPPMIRNEDAQLVGFVFVDVKNSMGVADFVELARQVVDDNVDLPPGYRLDWAGQFKYFERAKEKLQVLIPVTLVLVFFMLLLHRGSLLDTLFILSAVPFALTGSIWLLFILEYKLSVAVWVGMIAMAGLAVEMGLLMLFYLDTAYKEWLKSDQSTSLLNAVVEGAGHRIRPMLMTSLTLFIGLIPVMISDGTGADVMKRIAAPMVGGTGTTLLVVLFVFPPAFLIWKRLVRSN